MRNYETVVRIRVSLEYYGQCSSSCGKGSALGDIERQIDFAGSSIKNYLDYTRQTENTSN